MCSQTPTSLVVKELAPPKEFMPQVGAMIASKERDSSSLEKASRVQSGGV